MRVSRTILVFLLLSAVSLFADITYEGARSIAGAYMDYLSAPAIFAGLLGIGELVSYTSRAISGGIVSVKSSSRLVWSLVILGYTVNLVAVPLLAFTGNWQYAFILLILERMGKGLRAPPRDIVLSEVTKSIGRGKGFGLHELMDQIGAVTGPLIVAWALSGQENYYNAFIILGIPAGIAIIMVLTASVLYSQIQSVKEAQKAKARIEKDFALFLAGTFLVTTGFLHWFLTGYHLTSNNYLSPEKIALLYMVAMLTDGLLALPIGYIYDKIGKTTIIPTPLLALASSILLINIKEPTTLVYASILWGATMSFFETVFRAIIPMFMPKNIGRGYGLYAVTQALAWGVGSIMMGILYSHNIHLLNYYFVITNIIAFIIYVKLVTQSRSISSFS